MTTIHLGDCLNGCATCADNYHEQFTDTPCDTCGAYEGHCVNCGSGYWFQSGETVRCIDCGIEA